MPGVETIEAFSLRLPLPLKDRISRSAKQNRRSLNAEMIVLMERALLPNEKAEAASATPA